MRKITARICIIVLSTCLVATAETDKEGRISATTESLKTSQGGEIRNINIESSSPQISDAKLNRDCFCTFEYVERSLNVTIGNTYLKTGDTIKHGETASAGCSSHTMLLEWKNGFRFNGRVNMTCSTCMKWKKDDIPTCSPITNYPFITEAKGHLKILPSGIIDVHMGENVAFICVNAYGVPYWDFKDRKNVRTGFYRLRGRQFSYTSTLFITRAADEHSGKYECFLRGDYGNRILSTFLHLEVKGTTTESLPLSTTPSSATVGRTPEVISVTGKPETVFTQNPSSKHVVENCFCEYLVIDENIFAYEDYKRLVYGDKVRNGSTVYFYCQYNYRRLLHRETCNDCKSWISTALPSCTTLSDGDCEIPAIAGGSLKEEIIGNYYYHWLRMRYERQISYNDIPAGSVVSDSKVLWLVCDQPNSSPGNGTNRKMVTCVNGRWSTDLQCLGDNVSCPEFPNSPGLQVIYTNRLSVSSVAAFQCSNKTQYLVGRNFSECQRNGSWSSPLPSCEVVREKFMQLDA